MRVLIVIVFSIMHVQAHAQEKSDIQYIKFTNVSKSLFGKPVQLDFYNRSFMAAKLDTVAILLEDHPLRFVEHRNDNNYNGRFSMQFLESIDLLDGHRVRIVLFEIDRATTDSILVTCYVVNADSPAEKPKKMKTWLEKKMVTEVLVRD